MGKQYFGRLIFLILFSVLWSPAGRAQSTEIDLKKKTIPVISEKKGKIYIRATNLVKGQRILFVRPDPENDDFEVISQGIVELSNSKITAVEILTDKMQKIPQVGDAAVLLSEPKKWTPAKKENFLSDVQISEEKPEPAESGYFEIGYHLAEGSLSSATSNQANSYKSINNYRFTGMHLEWFVDFLPNYGITLDTISGKVPVYSYFRNLESTTYSMTKLKINFRNTVLEGQQFRWRLYLASLKEDFATSNPDEYILGSQYTATGLGTRVGYEFSPTLVFKTQWFGKPQSVYLDICYYPSFSAVDSVVKRGSASNGSTRSEITAGYIHNFYWEIVPWFKRYFVDAKYSISNSQISFQGATTSESNGTYVVPEGGKYSEINQQLQITFGIRMEDYLGHALKPRH